MDGITSLVWGATGLILAVYIALIAAGIIGAICSIIGLVRGITNHNTTAIAVGGVGVGCAVLGIFVLPIVFWIACFVCGTMACQLSKQQHVLSYEEFKRQKAMMQDPEYAEYMRNVHGVEDASEKHGGKAMYESCPELGDMSVADMRKAGRYLHKYLTEKSPSQGAAPARNGAPTASDSGGTPAPDGCEPMPVTGFGEGM